jgi:hypothetical protein
MQMVFSFQLKKLKRRMMFPSNQTLNRREFLKSIGVAAAGFVAMPWMGLQKNLGVSLAEWSLQEWVPLRIGVVVPTYTQDRRRASHWLKGLRFGLSQSPGTTLIPYTANDREFSVSRAVKELAHEKRAEVIVGSVSPFAMASLASALAETSAVFLNAEVGANLVFPSEKQENVFHHTLHYWQANWAAGA